LTFQRQQLLKINEPSIFSGISDHSDIAILQ